MDKLCISTNSNQFSPNFFKVFIPLCQSSKFSRSNKGEIRGVEKEDGPFSVLFKLCE
jgi:hypothetical protein